MDIRELQPEEARAVLGGLSAADVGLPAGREFYYEIVGQSRTIQGLLVDFDDHGVTLANIGVPENTHQKLPWDEVASVTVRGHGIRR